MAVEADSPAVAALCAVFERFGGGAAVETRYRGPDDGTDFERPVTWVRTWIPEADAGARALVEEELWRLHRDDGLPEAVVRPLARANWAEAWKAHFRPLSVGPFLVVPEWWAEDGADDDRDGVDARAAGTHVIRLDPGMAFGTGQHPTTRLCLTGVAAELCGGDEADGDSREGALDRSIAGTLGAGRSVLDVGTGSGVLAIAAARLGARRVVGVDIDPAAIEAARANAGRNGVAIELREGSLDALATAGDYAPFDLVLANLLAHTLRDLAPDLWAWTAPGGTLIGSGILAEQVDDVIGALEGAGYLRRAVEREGDWAAIVLDRRPDA